MAKEEEDRPQKTKTANNENLNATDSEQPTSPGPSTSKPTKSKKNVFSPAACNALVIARNKHWRFISSFHGAWLQLPVEIIEIVANLNYTTPRPRPMDPAVVFDVLKVRKSVDEATAFAVGAANDVASSTLLNVNSGVPHLNSLGHGAKLSKERKQRMRELACQKLARAYRLDEIACSVVTMQGTSALETVGALVLQRKQDNLDAKYCHFFFEKIPSRQLVTSTSLEPLEEIIASGHGQAEALRTRATVKIFREDFDGAIRDLTEGLRLARYRKLPHSPPAPNVRFRNPNTVLSEDEQPTGLVEQLLFQRATAYLAQACRFVDRSFPPADTEDGEEMSNARHEFRKHVKLLARLALKDYMSFLSHFDYSPNLPTLFMIEFHRDIAVAAKQAKTTGSYNTLSHGHTVYNVTELFAAMPPPNLPEYPPEAAASNDTRPAGAKTTAATMELVTYHPLLTEALHATLLCHCLVQTSVKELQRHANMVARLVRLCNGDPIFRETRSSARTDWTETLRRTDNWIHLSDTWEALCAAESPFDQQQQPDHFSAAAASLLHGDKSSSSSAAGGKPQPTGTPLKPNHVHPFGGPVPSGTPESKTMHDPHAPGSRVPDEHKDYPYITERAFATSRWVRDAPIVTGISKRRRRTRRAGAKDEGVVDEGLVAAMDNLTLSEAVEEE